MVLSPDDIRGQVERILSSNTFANAGRLSRLLDYVVERTVAGEGERLKEYVLGVEVFDRGDAFDPRLDSIVRVEARRLRSKLEEYYRGPGNADQLVITIPRGSYAPVFAAALHPQPQRRSTVVRWLTASGLIAGVLTLLLITGARSRPDGTPTARASSRPSIAVLPFQHYSPREADAMLAARITDEVTAELARGGTVAVASRTSASQYTGEVRSVREIAKALDVDFVMEASLSVDTNTLRVVARLVDGVLDRKVWVGEYDSSPAEIVHLSRQIAAEAAAGAVKFSSNR